MRLCRENLGKGRKDYKGWLESATRNGKTSREPAWSESIAVGSKAFINNINEKLGVKAKWGKRGLSPIVLW